MKTALKTIAILFLAGAMLYFRLSAEPGTHTSHTTSVHHTRSGRTYTRSPEVRRQFQHLYPCPSTGKTYGPCRGFVVDHVNPLACGGPDATENMAWQTNAAAKMKDAWELNCTGHPR
jgi:hypothetical protein